MSKEIWTPTGSNAQTDIDILIEKCKFHQKNAENHLHYSVNELNFIKENIDEISNHLDLLRDTRNIVSMREFSILRDKNRDFKEAKIEVMVEVANLEKEIKYWNEKINKLKMEREKLSTKVLEFKRGKRKRSKNRK